MEEASNVRESTLCDKCSILRIEDKEMGDRIAQNDAGEAILGMNDTDEYFGELRLDHTHHDVLPDLPCLRASVEAGCAFCVLLRSAALQLNVGGHPGQVTSKLSYFWEDYTNPRWGLRRLAVGMYHHYLRIEFPMQMNFYVDCEEGRCQRWLNTALTPRAETLCKENVAWMRQALDECNTECRSPSTPNLFPTRLIDLGDANHGGSICLIESSSA